MATTDPFEEIEAPEVSARVTTRTRSIFIEKGTRVASARVSIDKLSRESAVTYARDAAARMWVDNFNSEIPYESVVVESVIHDLTSVTVEIRAFPD